MDAWCWDCWGEIAGACTFGSLPENVLAALMLHCSHLCDLQWTPRCVIGRQDLPSERCRGTECSDGVLCNNQRARNTDALSRTRQNAS